MLTVLVGMTLVPTIGSLLDLFWSGDFSAEGVRVYTDLVFQKSFLFVPLCPLLAFVCAYFSKETNPEFIKKNKHA